jgi:hypothetical protein
MWKNMAVPAPTAADPGARDMTTVDRVAALFDAMITHRYLPTRLRMGVLMEIHKPAKPADQAASYRPICILLTLYRLLDRVIANRTADFVENTYSLPDGANGFRTSRGARHVLFQATEHARATKATRGAHGAEPAWKRVPDPTGARPTSWHTDDEIQAGHPLGLWLQDATAAYDLADRDVILAAQWMQGMRGRMWGFNRVCMNCQEREVSVGGTRSQRFWLALGVMQGGCSSPLLFSVGDSTIPATYSATKESEPITNVTQVPLALGHRRVICHDPRTGFTITEEGGTLLLTYADDKTSFVVNNAQADRMSRVSTCTTHRTGGVNSAGKETVLTTRPEEITIRRYRIDDQGDLQPADTVPIAPINAEDKARKKLLGVRMDPHYTFGPHARVTVDNTVQALNMVTIFMHTLGAMAPAVGIRRMRDARSLTQFAAEVWAVHHRPKLRAIDTATTKAACATLGIPTAYAPRAAVLREVGFQNVQTMTIQATLQLLAELQVMHPSRGTRDAFEVSMALHRDQQAGEPAPAGTWAVAAAAAAREADMLALMDTPDVWIQRHAATTDPDGRRQRWPGRGAMDTPAVQTQWIRAARAAARAQVRQWDLRQQETAIVQHSGLVDNNYLDLHPTAKKARYLDLATTMPAATVLRVRLRIAVYPLAATVHAHSRPNLGEAAAMHCPLCGAAKETPRHTILECPHLTAVRGNLCGEVGAAIPDPAKRAQYHSMTTQVRRELAWQLLLGGEPKALGLRPHDLKAVHRATAPTLCRIMGTRERKLKTTHLPPLAQRAQWRVYPGLKDMP